MIEIHSLIPYAILIFGIGLGILLSTWYFLDEVRKMHVPDYQVEGKQFVLNQGKLLRIFGIGLVATSLIWTFFLNFLNA